MVLEKVAYMNTRSRVSAGSQLEAGRVNEVGAANRHQQCPHDRVVGRYTPPLAAPTPYVL